MYQNIGDFFQFFINLNYFLYVFFLFRFKKDIMKKNWE